MKAGDLRIGDLFRFKDRQKIYRTKHVNVETHLNVGFSGCICIIIIATDYEEEYRISAIFEESEIILVSEKEAKEWYTHPPCKSCGSIDCFGNHCECCGRGNCDGTCCSDCRAPFHLCVCDGENMLAGEDDEHHVSVPDLIDMEEVNDD